MAFVLGFLYSQMLHLYLVNGVPKNFFHGFRQYVFCPNINIIFREPSIERKFKNLDVYVFNNYWSNMHETRLQSYLKLFRYVSRSLP